jgi:hypothetical protein
VECKKLGLAPIDDIVERGDAQSGERARRWCADIGEVAS